MARRRTPRSPSAPRAASRARRAAASRSRIDTPHGPVRIGGRIDRIDLAAEDEPGCQVIDYKTGPRPSKADMAAGTSFQLPIYLWALEALLSQAERGGRARAFFLPIRRPGQSAAIASPTAKGKPRPEFQAALDRAEAYIRQLHRRDAPGLFPVYPRGLLGVLRLRGPMPLRRVADRAQVGRESDLNRSRPSPPTTDDAGEEADA